MALQLLPTCTALRHLGEKQHNVTLLRNKSLICILPLNNSFCKGLSQEKFNINTEFLCYLWAIKTPSWCSSCVSLPHISSELKQHTTCSFSLSTCALEYFAMVQALRSFLCLSHRFFSTHALKTNTRNLVFTLTASSSCSLTYSFILPQMWSTKIIFVLISCFFFSIWKYYCILSDQIKKYI